jgi:hypothetical protein
VFLFSKLGYLDVHHDQDSIHHAMDRKRLEIVSEILMVGNDIQMLLGISYMVSIFSSVASMDTYHLHLMYDIVSFVGLTQLHSQGLKRFSFGLLDVLRGQTQS